MSDRCLMNYIKHCDASEKGAGARAEPCARVVGLNVSKVKSVATFGGVVKSLETLR